MTALDCKLALSTVMSVGSAPLPNLARVTLSFANLEPEMSALAFISALTIVPSTMFALATVISVGKAPLPSFAKVTLSSASLLPALFALLFISTFTIDPSTILAEFTVIPLGKLPVAILILFFQFR